MYDENTRLAFVELGQSMKKYSISQIVLGVLSLIGAGLIYLMVFSVEHFGRYMIIGIVVFVVLIFIFSIMILVYFIKYLGKLKNVASQTHDIQLEKSYKMQLWGFLMPIICGIIGGLIMMGSLFFIVNEILADPNFTFEGYMMIIYPLIINQMGMNGIMMPQSIMMLIPGVLIIILAGLIGLILNILGILAFEEWSQNYLRTMNNSPSAYKITKGTELMKWGYIIQIFASGIGTIIYLIALIQTGNALIEEFGQPKNQMRTQYGIVTPQPISSQQATTFPSYIPNQELNRTVVEKQPPKFCIFCGNALDISSAKFCPNCGKSLE